MNQTNTQSQVPRFLRQNPVVSGVAGGIAATYDVPAWLIRLVFFISFFTSFGLTLLLYFTAAVSFTSKAQYQKSGESPKLLGVCYSLAPTIGIDVGWLRFIVLITSIFTGFFPIPFFYIVTYFCIDKNKTEIV